jgi:3-dehydroquinate dehydratase / shikimate dehydrogenase
MNCEICVSITANDVERCIEDIKQAEAYSDLIELRLDYVDKIDEEKLEKILGCTEKKVIVTCRNLDCGGKFSGIEDKRIMLFEKAIELGADFIDIEIESGKETINRLLSNKKTSKIIISAHFFDRFPKLGLLENKYDEIKSFNPDLIKIVPIANSINDNFKVFELLKDKSDLISFCMGIQGQMSRILSAKFGSRITYASLAKGKESAHGQIPIQDLLSTYNLSTIDEKTEVLGVIGEFAENSMSKYMHNPAFKDNKLNFVYMPFKVASHELGGLIKNIKDYGFAGCSVTVPHKIKIMNYLDKLDITAKNIGAVNTVKRSGSNLVGYNTDYYGAVNALREKVMLKGKKVLVLGAGGAARAIIYGLKNESAILTVINRTQDKAVTLAHDFEVNHDDIKNIGKLIEENDILINATSIGMNPNADTSPIDEKFLKKGLIVMDIVYNPIQTKLIRASIDAGCDVITGDKMLLYQAMRQFELWTDSEPDKKLMVKSLSAQIEGGN